MDSTDGINTPGGTPWFVDNGYIKTWDGDNNFLKLYGIDRSIANVSISSKDNLIAWNQDTEVYSIIHNIPSKTVGIPNANATATTSAAATIGITKAQGWVLTNDNTWYYLLDDGTKKTGWTNSNGTWYYLKSNGVMATGWVKDNGIWYYLSETGAMKSGWIKDNDTWYYCNPSGAMEFDTIIDGYILDVNGALI